MDRSPSFARPIPRRRLVRASAFLFALVLASRLVAQQQVTVIETYPVSASHTVVNEPRSGSHPNNGDLVFPGMGGCSLVLDGGGPTTDPHILAGLSDAVLEVEGFARDSAILRNGT